MSFIITEERNIKVKLKKGVRFGQFLFFLLLTMFVIVLIGLYRSYF